MEMCADQRAAYVDAVVKDIQVSAGAAPYATIEELIDIFRLLAERTPSPATQEDQMILRRLFATVVFHIYQRAGADVPLGLIENLVADADDPRVEFKEALSALARLPNVAR